MFAGHQPCLKRAWCTLASVAIVAALAVPVAAAPASAGVRAAARAPRAAKAFRQVSYRGYSFEVPTSWRVVDLSGTRPTCVRFDRHAIYLGSPDSNESCPSFLVGTTEAMLIQPEPKSWPASSVEDPVARKVTVTEPRIKITATFDDDRSQIFQILASASLPAPIVHMPRPLDAAIARRGPAVGRARSAATTTLSAKVANYQGLGFDACAAPSAAYMRAWRQASPYRAIGVYIGGSDESCDQPNLTRTWLSRQAAAGWHFIPMYVGPQAEFNELYNHPGHQGRQAANDAVLDAERLGFGPWTPIYYDMEAYLPARTDKALRFLSAWTSRLHALGYLSGVYSSSDSGITDLAQRYFRHKWAIPDVIYDALWNGKRTSSVAVIRADEWPGHRRVHQFAGNVTGTYGGDAISLDEDYLNVLLSPPKSLPASPGPTEKGPARSARARSARSAGSGTRRDGRDRAG